MLACNTPCACGGKYGVEYALYICVLFCALPVTWKAVTQAKPSTTMQQAKQNQAVQSCTMQYITVQFIKVQCRAVLCTYSMSLAFADRASIAFFSMLKLLPGEGKERIRWGRRNRDEMRDREKRGGCKM
jgi:hypothetical protein